MLKMMKSFLPQKYIEHCILETNDQSSDYPSHLSKLLAQIIGSLL